MKRTLLLLAAAAMPMLAATPGIAQTQAAQQVQFTLPALPYTAGALDPVIDAQTMQLHHGKHHQAYVDALNKAVTETPSLRGLSLEQIVARAGSVPKAARDNAGGHWNHSFFWKTMTPVAGSGAPSAALRQAIDRQFGSLDRFKAAFKEAGTKRFGSGWVWLIVKPDGALAITSTPNQDNPLMDVAEVKGKPVLGNDVWEHAYYLKHQNRRADYLDGWWQVVDWKTVSERYAAARR